jgi:hypothetical protein
MRVTTIFVEEKKADYANIPVTIIHGTIVVDLDRIIIIERGEWDNTQQDWKAVLVFDTGLRRETGMFLREMVHLWKTYKEPNPCRDELK